MTARGLVLGVAVACAGCAGMRMRQQVGAVGRVISAARANGAQVCAPIELALAEAHHDFADVELDEGDYYRARQELTIAEQNAHDALRKSPRGKCGRVAAAPGDRDADGIVDDRDECPSRPEDRDGFEDGDGCPETDNDHDGLADAVDSCPDKAEDRDAFEDDDGCPEDDNDGDKMVDRLDQCPVEPEDADGVDDDDGCPDCDDDKDGVTECPEPLDKCPGEAGTGADGCAPKYKNVVVTATHIELKQTVYFDTRKATIKRVSYGLLDEVAQVLEDHPTIQVRIEGHTDSQGKDAFNLKLSRSRAASVRQYLMGQGIDGSRMVSEGYGERQPLADNRTAAGRAENRRVEFVITSH
ncbi:MAG TPA: OmpA family protein [Kofleriaceae bacterium]|nr:OmpA family protein [Kofleriaceae bacterium]